MKRIIFLSLLIGLICIPSQAEERIPFLAEVKSDDVNIRAGESKSFESLGMLKKGDEVVVVGKVPDWYKIKLPPGANSYIHSDYVKVISGDIGEVKKDRVNIRANAGVNFSGLGQLRQGTKVRILSQDNGWVKIEPIEGTYGWVATEFLTFKSKDIPAAHTIQAPSRSIYRKQMATTQASQTEKKGMPPFTATGKLILQEDSPGAGAHYLLSVDEQHKHVLQAPEWVLQRFLNQQVNVEGKPIPAQESLPAASVTVTKIRFVL